MSNEVFFITADSVYLEDFKVMCGDCERKMAAKIVRLDLMNNGLDIQVGQPMCNDCAIRAAQRLRKSLRGDSKKEK